MHITKMHGLGNDFIIIDDKCEDLGGFAKKACQRRVSVGADGVMAVLPSAVADVKMRIINADGSEAEMCGNGIRCFARYVYDKGIVRKKRMEIETLAGVMKPSLTIGDGGEVASVSVDMGAPSFSRSDIPMFGTGSALEQEINAGGKAFVVSALLMGVPHAVVFTDDIEAHALQYGPLIEKHEYYPRKINVNFVHVIDERNISVATWERGAGRTLACGTGACASVVVSALRGLTQKSVAAHLLMGDLLIDYLDNGRVVMSGPAQYVFEGEYTQEG